MSSFNRQDAMFDTNSGRVNYLGQPMVLPINNCQSTPRPVVYRSKPARQR